MAAPFCANCISPGPALRPRQLDEGGPIYLFCERCDSEVTADMIAVAPPDGARWTGGRYFPLDQLEQSMPVRILRALRRFDWLQSRELSDALHIPSTIESPVEQNTYSVTLSRLCREGYVEMKVVTARAIRRGYSRRHSGGYHQWNEYRITQLGRDRLEWALACTMAPIHYGRQTTARTPDSPPPAGSAGRTDRPRRAARRAS